MTTPLTTPAEPPPPHARVELTATHAERIANAVEAELAASTRETCACGWRQWERRCSGRGIQPLPAPPQAIAAFLAERAEAGIHFSTLDCYCPGIAHRHRQEGLADPTADFLVRRVRRGLRRILGVAPIRQAHRLTVAELHQIVASIDTDDAKDIRDRAILLLGYASAMRPGEISAFNIEDLLRKPTGILITIRRSKTDPDAQGQLIGVARGESRLTDPIRALDAWLKVRPSGPGALFTRVLYRNHPRSERIGPRAISRTVQERANAAGFDGISVSGPSLRAGHATMAAVNGAPIDRIAAQTRHRDLGTLLNHYIRPAEAMATTTSRDLGLRTFVFVKPVAAGGMDGSVSHCSASVHPSVENERVRILVVEDETRLAASLHAALETEGYQVDVAPDGAQGLWMAQEYPHDVILLDLMLPELSGLDVCSRLRSAGNWTPILVLTARDGVEDEVGALTTGADDYLAKPFSMAVLLARLRLLARRGAAERPAVITVGDVGLDPASKRVTRAGHEVAVTAREYLMLEFLMRNRDLALSKQQILDYVWDYDFSGDSNIVEVYVRRLRAKLDDGRAGTSIIQTLRGIGYRMSSDEG